MSMVSYWISVQHKGVRFRLISTLNWTAVNNELKKNKGIVLSTNNIESYLSCNLCSYQHPEITLWEKMAFQFHHFILTQISLSLGETHDVVLLGSWCVIFIADVSAHFVLTHSNFINSPNFCFQNPSRQNHFLIQKLF